MRGRAISAIEVYHEAVHLSYEVCQLSDASYQLHHKESVGRMLVFLVDNYSINPWPMSFFYCLNTYFRYSDRDFPQENVSFLAVNFHFF